MKANFYHDRRKQLVLKTVIAPTLVAILLLALAIGTVLKLSTAGSDAASVRHQTHLVEVALRSALEAVAKDQEASTHWDDAVLQVTRRPLDLDWIDQNLGVWFNEYYGHDETYLLDAADRPIYAMRDGRRVTVAAFIGPDAFVLPRARHLRARLKRGDVPPPGVPGLTLGAIEPTIVRGRPAIVSLKPIVPETGKIPQVAGAEHLHVSIRYLDGSLVRTMAQTYDIDGLAFSWQPANQASLALRSGSGTPLGYLNWTPFKPGEAVAARLIPVFLLVLALLGAALAWLLTRILRTRIEVEASRAHAQHLAFHDPLTGLPNRALMAERLDQALGRAACDGLALILLDLDRFKNVNDTLGHLAGDALIVQFGRRLTDLVRDTDTVARLGGDEFAVLRTPAMSRRDVEMLCERLLDVVRTPFQVLSAEAFVGVSMGVVFAEPGSDRNELLRKADIALYFAKDEGRDCYRMFAPEMDAGVQLRASLEDDLRRALEAGDQLVLHYQPQVSASGNEVVGVEALLRWMHPARGCIPPDQFIPVAETTGLIRPLGDFVIREACRAALRWPGLTIAINVSPVQFRQQGFARHVRKMMHDAGVAPAQIQIEITESVLLGDEREVVRSLRMLRQAGFSIALDDFGIGYSSLGYLRKYKVDKIKIDRSFVQALGTTGDSGAIVRAVLALARAMHLAVTAEGVETAEQRDFLLQAGCGEMQGFLFGAAVPADKVDMLLIGGKSLGTT